jgi:ATP-binding cassette subfamily B protein
MTGPSHRDVPPAPEHDAPPSWRDRVRALRYVPPLIAMVWRTHRGFTASMAVLRVLRAFVPIAALWIGKLIIDGVVEARETGASWRTLLPLIGMEIAIVVAGELLARASVIIESMLGDLFSNRMSVRLMEHAATLDLAQFEDPAFYDHLERARRQTIGRIGLLSQLLAVGQDSLTLGTLSAALLAYNPWLLLLLVIAILPALLLRV